MKPVLESCVSKTGTFNIVELLKIRFRWCFIIQQAFGQVFATYQMLGLTHLKSKKQMAINATKWLTVCLHYNEPWDEFLTKAVRPYVEVVLQTGIAESFHFERSWERGPHIRLRFKSTEFLLEKMLLPNLLEHFQQYFDFRPSFLIEPKYFSRQTSGPNWHPNNSIQILDNQSDTTSNFFSTHERFFENQYHLSARLALFFLKQHENSWTVDERLGTALKLHLGMLYAFDLGLEHAQNFSAWAYKNWEAKAGETAGAKLDKELMRINFHSAFERQRMDLLSYLTATWELFRNYRKVESPAFVRWIHVNTKANLELQTGLHTNQLKPCKTSLEAPTPIWTFYADFIEKTNNRLGILHTYDVGYLYYTMSQCLKLMAQNAIGYATRDYSKSTNA